MTTLSPALPNDYQQSTAGALGVLLLTMREEIERAAARRVEENAALRELFREAIPVVEEASLRSRVESAAQGSDPGLRLGELEAANAELRGLLVDLHAHVEELDSDAAWALDEAIWAELVRSTDRRLLTMAF